jgi:hypothetical protein
MTSAARIFLYALWALQMPVTLLGIKTTKASSADADLIKYGSNQSVRIQLVV